MNMWREKQRGSANSWNENDVVLNFPEKIHVYNRFSRCSALMHIFNALVRADNVLFDRDALNRVLSIKHEILKGPRDKFEFFYSLFALISNSSYQVE